MHKSNGTELIFFDVNQTDARYTKCDTTANTVRARYGTGGGNTPLVLHIVQQPGKHYIVRRLMPKECARLQGFPPDWCDDVPHSDSAEYKLWGNGIALCSLDFLCNAVRVVKERMEEDGKID